MSIDIQKLYALPDISFIEDVSYEQILNEMIGDYEKKYEEQTKQKIVLRPGDKDHIHLRIEAGQYFQMYQILDNAAKMNLLKYSRGDFLKHLGAFKKTFIQEPKPAIVKMRFNLSEIRKDVIYIPQGTRVTAGDGVYFAVDASCCVYSRTVRRLGTFDCRRVYFGHFRARADRKRISHDRRGQKSGAGGG